MSLEFHLHQEVYQRLRLFFDIDANCVLVVSATDKSSGNMQKMEINNDNGNLSEEQMNAVILYPLALISDKFNSDFQKSFTGSL